MDKRWCVYLFTLDSFTSDTVEYRLNMHCHDDSWYVRSWSLENLLDTAFELIDDLASVRKHGGS